VATASATVAAEVIVFSTRARVSPAETMAGFWATLVENYGGPSGATGLTSVRAWLLRLPLSPTAIDAVWIGVAALLVFILWALWMRRSHESDEANRLALLAGCCLASLLTIYHNGHNLILLFPACVFIVSVEDRATRRERVTIAAALQAAMMGDAPVRLAALAWTDGWLRALALNVDRIVVLMAFGYVARLWWRLGAYDKKRESRNPRERRRLA
jgi:hypothetical protein